jgi:TRAP-type C4-dicarboxylate transport system permease small subunit
MSKIEAAARAGETVLQTIVAITLFVIMTVTFVDVTGRYVFLRPLPAAYELTELLMALGVFGAMPLAARSQEHITISLLDGLFTDRAMKIRTFIVSVMCATISFALAYVIWLRGLRLMAQGEFTLFLKAPLAPFAFFVAIMSALMGICFLLAAVGRVAGPSKLEDMT